MFQKEKEKLLFMSNAQKDLALSPPTNDKPFDEVTNHLTNYPIIQSIGRLGNALVWFFRCAAMGTRYVAGDSQLDFPVGGLNGSKWAGIIIIIIIIIIVTIISSRREIRKGIGAPKKTVQDFSLMFGISKIPSFPTMQ